VSATNIYGPIWSAKQIERRVIGSLEDWLTFYLGEMERLDGYAPDSIQRPLGYVRAPELSKYPEDQVPCIVVMAREAIPKKTAPYKEYEATFPVAVAPIVSDTDKDSSQDLAGTYAAAIRASIIQHKRLKSTAYPDGIEGSVEWAHEGYMDLAFSSSRSLGTASGIFNVTIDVAVAGQAGPRELPTEPPSVDPGDWPDLLPGQPTVVVNPVEVLP
jgi:hypothetical protein